VLLAQHTALDRVGRRVAPESASEVLSARNDEPAEFFSSLSISAIIRVIRGEIFALIRVHLRLKKLKWSLVMFRVGFDQLTPHDKVTTATCRLGKNLGKNSKTDPFQIPNR